MEIRAYNNIYSRQNKTQVEFKGGLQTLSTITPIYRYSRRYLNKVANETSKIQIEPLVKELIGISKEIQIPTKKNNIISALDVKSENGNYILFLHGMAQNITNYQDLYKAAVKRGYGIFAVEYRGYGKNPKTKVCEDTLRQDVEAAYQYLTKEKKVKPENIIVVGHSMGGTLGVNLTSKHKDIKNLILISPICNLVEIGDKFATNKAVGGGTPIKVLNLTKRFNLLKWLHSLNFNSFSKMKKNKVPTYIIHSKNDVVSTQHGVNKLSRIARTNKTLCKYYITQSGGHKVDKTKVDIVGEILDKITQG